jgi:hypothetical protein
MRPIQISLWLSAAVLSVGGAAPCHADTVTFKNGREIHGRLVDETLKEIRIRTAGGEMVITKDKVATFSENDSWEEYEKPRSVAQIEADKIKAAADKDKDEDEDKDKDKTKDKTKDKDKTPDTPKNAAELREDAWEWDSGLTEEQIEECTPLRDQLWADLDLLGPTDKERLDKLVLSGEEQTAVKSILYRMSLNRRQGSAVIKRKTALKELIGTYGLKAADLVVKQLSGDNLWSLRMASEAIAQLSTKGEKDEAKWLFYHYKAPAELVRLLEHQGESDSPWIRQDAAKALAAVTGQTFGWNMPDKPDSMRSTIETKSFRRWRDWWKRFGPWWENREKENAEKRVKLGEDLDNLSKGIAPDGSTPGKDS